MQSITQLDAIITDLKANGKAPKVTLLRSAAKRNRKSALGVKSHSSNGRRFNNNNSPLCKVG
jgi:hypothetical protein